MAIEPGFTYALIPIESPYRLLRRSRLPAGEGGRRLARLLRGLGWSAPEGEPKADLIAWDEKHFSLDRSSWFQSLSASQKNTALSAATRMLLEEALLIEVAGLSYCSKMGLLSETLIQRELYAHMAADEANHYRMIASLIGEPSAEMKERYVFIGFLEKLILEETPGPLILLTQVILEGWGIPHYAQLAARAIDPAVREIFKEIVRDEAAHHGSGLVLFRESELSASELDRLTSHLGFLLGMITLGPAGIIGLLAGISGGCDEGAIRAFLDETAFSTKVASDLALMRHLLSKAGAKQLLSRCEQQGWFEVPTAERCSARITAILGVRT